MLFIHIGMHKAGSSSIQAFLTANAARLAEQDVSYPATSADSNAQHHLARSIKAAAPAPEWRDVVRIARERTVVLSSEHFCLIEPRLLSETLGDAQVRILCWQRNAADGMVSRYSQETRRGRNIQPFDVFMSRLSDSEQLFIAPTMRRWADTFGPEAIRLRSLDPEVLEGGALICDLLHALEVAPDPGFVDPGPQNISPGWRALETIRRLSIETLRRNGPPDRKTLRFMRTLLPQAVIAAEAELGLRRRGAYLSPAQAADLTERYNRDIDALSAMGLDCRMKPLRPDQVATTDAPLTEKSMPWEVRGRLLQAAIVGLSGLDARGWRSDRAEPAEEEDA